MGFLENVQGGSFSACFARVYGEKCGVALVLREMDCRVSMAFSGSRSAAAGRRVGPSGAIVWIQGGIRMIAFEDFERDAGACAIRAGTQSASRTSRCSRRRWPSWALWSASLTSWRAFRLEMGFALPAFPCDFRFIRGFLRTPPSRRLIREPAPWFEAIHLGLGQLQSRSIV